MMKQFNLSENSKYRWMVFSRCILAIVIGFLIANLSVPIIAFIFHGQKVLATYSGLMLSFIVWLLVIIYVFSVKTARKAWLVIGGVFLLMYLFLNSIQKL